MITVLTKAAWIKFCSKSASETTEAPDQSGESGSSESGSSESGSGESGSSVGAATQQVEQQGRVELDHPLIRSDDLLRRWREVREQEARAIANEEIHLRAQQLERRGTMARIDLWHGY